VPGMWHDYCNPGEADARELLELAAGVPGLGR